MEETKAMLGILLISAIAVTSYFVITSGLSGAATSQSYVACCCNVLATDGQQVLVRSQIQTFAGSCTQACQKYEELPSEVVFPQEGLCAANP
jgi:hypothetical protein